MFRTYALLFTVFLAPAAHAGSKGVAQQLYEEGIELYRRGNIAEAFSRLSRSISEYNGFLPAYALRAQARHALGDTSGIDSDIQHALEITNPRKAEDFVARGNARVLNHEIYRALSDFNAAIGQDLEDSDAYVGRGKAYQALGDQDRAVADWKKALKVDPELVIARYNLAWSLHETGHNQQALNELTEALRINSKFHFAYGLLGAIFASQGDLERAQKAYSKGLRLFPEYAYAHLGLAFVHLGQGRQDLAFRDLEGAIGSAPEDCTPYYNRGEIYYRKGNKEAAFADFRKAAKLHMETPSIAIAMGNRFLENHLPKDAVDMYSRAWGLAQRHLEDGMRVEAETALVMRSRALSALPEEDSEKALKDLTWAIEISSGSPALWTERAKLYQKMSRLSKAQDDLEYALSSNPRYAPALVARGGLKAKRGLSQEALKDFNAALQIDPHLAEAYNNRGVLYATVYGDYDKAVSDIKKAISLDEKNPGFYVNLGAARIKRNEPWKAIAALNLGLSLRAPQERVLQLRAEAYDSLGNRTKAYLDINDALRIKPKSAALMTTRGYFRMRAREYPQAVEELTTAIEQDNQNARAYLFRGLAQAGLGEYHLAISDFLQAADLEKKPGEALTCACQAMRLNGRLRSAVDLCSRAIASDSEYAPAYIQRGLAYLAMGEFSQAVRDLDDGTRLGVPQAPALLARSLAHAALKQYREADQAFCEAMAIDSRRKIADITFGNDSASKWDYYSHIMALEESLNQDSDDPYTFLVRGDAFHSAAYYDKAILEYTHAMELNGSLAAAYLDRGRTLAAHDSLDAAESDLRRAVELDPEDPYACLRLVTLLTARGKYAEGVKSAAASLRQHPRNAEMFVKAGNLHYFLKDMMNARKNYMTALKNNPNSASAHNGLGLCYFSRRQYNDAIENFTYAIAIDPNHDRFYRNRASAYVNMGDFADAVSDYKSALAVTNDPDMANEYQKLIRNNLARATPEKAVSP